MSTRRGESIAQRVASTRARAEADGRPTPGPRPEPEPAPPPVRHCWYDGPHGRQAALLLEWRRVEGGYDGRIAVVAPDAGGWVLVEMWVGQGMLTAG